VPDDFCDSCRSDKCDGVEFFPQAQTLRKIKWELFVQIEIAMVKYLVIYLARILLNVRYCNEMCPDMPDHI
jgi:hypothetical protein